MNQDIFEWILLLARWLHITVAVTWIGTSIFFMWLDRSFEKNPNSTRPGHVGEVWMVHGGGFYHVEKLLMGPTKVPDRLHWFKWESYWTWMSGMFLVGLIFYTGDGTFLLDEMVSKITFGQGILISLFSIFGSWFFYDLIWESSLTKKNPAIGHVLTFAWLAGMSYFLCHTLSGRAAYIHIGGMMGTWMTANVFMRIIPRQLKMVEASRQGEPVNQDWGKNAKNRSTHNTYLTLPVIFVMLSNHFPNTYGHEYNWLILLLITIGGACIREYFVVRLSNPKRSMTAAIIGVAIITGVIVFSQQKGIETAEPHHFHQENASPEIKPIVEPVVSSGDELKPEDAISSKTFSIKGSIEFEGVPPQGKKLNLPSGCAKPGHGDVYSNEVIVNQGKVENVLVRIIQGQEGKGDLTVPNEEIILDQKGCIYLPRVTAARVGQKVTFLNSDPIFHNVRAVTKENQKFNVAMPKKDQRETKIFTKPEIVLQTKCSVHPWMSAYIAVMEHPFFSVSNEKGEFKLPAIGPGKYVVEVWHEIFGTQRQEIVVHADGIKDLVFKFKQ